MKQQPNQVIHDVIMHGDPEGKSKALMEVFLVLYV